MMIDDVEPTILLRSGHTVRLATYDVLNDLQRNGHVVRIDEHGDLDVSPITGLHPDFLYTLDVLKAEIALLLADSAVIH